MTSCQQAEAAYNAIGEAGDFTWSQFLRTAGVVATAATPLVQVTHGFQATDGQVRSDLEPIESEIGRQEAALSGGR